MGRDDVLLQGRVLRSHSLMRARFTDLDIMPAEKAHDFTADYMVRVPDDPVEVCCVKAPYDYVLASVCFSLLLGCFFWRQWSVAGSGVQACHFVCLDLFA